MLWSAAHPRQVSAASPRQAQLAASVAQRSLRCLETTLDSEKEKTDKQTNKQVQTEA